MEEFKVGDLVRVDMDAIEKHFLILLSNNPLKEDRIKKQLDRIEVNIELKDIREITNIYNEELIKVNGVMLRKEWVEKISFKTDFEKLKEKRMNM